MRLVQKNLAHTGYAIFEDGRIIPCFTDNILEEVRNKVNKGTPTGIYATNKDMVHVLMNHINYYKEVYGVVPQNYVAELRTGFNNGCGLHQHNIA